MGKKTVFTNITPLPPHVSREVAVAMLHNHDEMIELNPLVVEHHPIKTPRDAAKDEFLDCAWQEMTDRISYLPGVKGKVTYKGCFHDLPNGLQTHIYAPMSLDIRERWTICGSLPGEPDEARELGLNVPRKGLYLREDGEMKCNMLMTSFVRKNLDNSHKVLVDRILGKAERVQNHLNSNATNSPAASIATEGFQRGSHMSQSNIVRQLSGGQIPTDASQRSLPLRRSNESNAGNPLHAPLQQDFAQDWPASGSQYVGKPLPVQPGADDINEAELQTVHPAHREQYRQSRSLGLSKNDTTLPAYHSLKNQQGQYYQNDLAKTASGKHFSAELEGDSSYHAAATSSYTQDQSGFSAEYASYISEMPDSSVQPSRTKTSYGPLSETSDASSYRGGRDGQSHSRNHSRSNDERQTSTLKASSDIGISDRYSVVSDISNMPTPKADQFAFNNPADNRYSVVSAFSEAPTPKFQQQSFASAQEARQAEQGKARSWGLM